MIIVDTEYTTWPGSLESGWAKEGEHREVVQIAAIRVDDSFNETEAFDVLVKPIFNPVLSDLFVDLTGITQKDVDTRGVSWPRALNQFRGFSQREAIICMNGDGGVFRENNNLHGIGMELPPFHRLRPFLEARGVDLSNLSSGDLHKLTPQPIVGHTHNALHDVRSMAVWLKYSGIKDIAELPRGIPDVDPRSLRVGKAIASKKMGQ